MGDVLLFDFVGKSGLEHAIFLEDKQLARIVHQCHELGGQDLFAYRSGDDVVDVTSTDINAYLAELAGPGVTAKTFRTWGGTTIAAATLALDRPPKSERQAEQAVLSAYDVAAQVLGNTRAVCRSCYVHPQVTDAYREGQLQEAWRASRASGAMRRGERTVLKVLEEGAE